jgi:hypothetical protein
MKKLIFAIAAAASAATAVPAAAERPHGSYGHGYDYERAGYRDYGQHTYDDYGRYREPRRLHRGDRVWRGNDGRYYCQRDNGTTGLIIGAAGGALLGRAVDTRGERTTGTILGAVLGGLLGRELDKGSARCR